MDPRRFLILAGLGLSLSGCAVFGRTAGPPPISPMPVLTAEAAVIAEAGALRSQRSQTVAPEPSWTVRRGPPARPPPRPI